MPEAYRLAGDAELAGDLGLTDADGEQLAGSQPAGLEPFTFLVCRRAASDGRHASILTRRAGPLQLGHHPSSRHPRPVNGSLLRREIQVQWPASTDRVKQHRKLGWRGRL